MATEPPADARSRAEARAWVGLALTTAAIYATIPLARAIQRLVTAHADRRVFAWTVVAVVVVAAMALYVSLGRSRSHDLPRRAAWLGAVAAAYVWLALELRAAPEESVHLLEYGVLSLVALRAISFRVPDRSAHIAAALIAVLAGTIDEVTQWLIPGRYFDFRDVAINAVGGTLIQIAIAWGVAPRSLAARASSRSLALVLRLLALDLAVLTMCVVNSPARVDWYAARVPGLGFLRGTGDVMCEFGYRFESGDLVAYSRFDRARLRDEDERRAGEAAAIVDAYREDICYDEFLARYGPGTDPFLHELRVHLFRRDRYLMIGRALGEEQAEARDNHLAIALGETRVLEEYFPASYGLSSYRLGRDDEALLARAPGGGGYESEVSRGLVTRVGEGGLVSGLAGMALVAWGVAGKMERRRKKED